MSFRFLRRPALAALVLTACIAPHSAGPGAPTLMRVRPGVPTEMAPERLPAWTHWEPVTVPLLHAPAQPSNEPLLMSLEVEERLGAIAAAEIHANRLCALAKAGPPERASTLLKDLRANNIPYVVTFSTLMDLAHRAFATALSNAAETQWDPALRKLLLRLSDRLEREQRDAKTDLVPAYVTSRGLVAVARALLDPTFTPPADVANVVKLELGHISRGDPAAKSDLLQVPVDYPHLAATTAHQPAALRAMAWLEHAALVLVGRGEEGQIGDASVALARTHTRASLLLARLLDPRLDPEASNAWETIERAAHFLWGSPDDLSPRDLAALASRLGASLEDPKWITNVVLVDRLRNLARENSAPTVYDGSGTFSLDEKHSKVTIAPTVRLFPTRDTPEAVVLQSLVYPFVGAQASGSKSDAARDGRRVFPRVLDVLAFLGSDEASAKLHEQGDDAFDGFDAQFKQLVSVRPSTRSLEWHSSVYVSMLDTIATYLGKSIADARFGDVSTVPLRQMRLSAAGAAWTRIRLASDRFAQGQVTPLAAPTAPTATSVEAYVEEQPEAIAKLLAFVRQLIRGFEAQGSLEAGSPARLICNEVDDILWDALGVVTKQLNDEPLDPKARGFLASFPERLARLEVDRAFSRVEIHHAPEFALFSFAELDGYRSAAWAMTRQGTHEPIVAVGPIDSYREVLANVASAPEK